MSKVNALALLRFLIFIFDDPPFTSTFTLGRRFSNGVAYRFLLSFVAFFLWTLGIIWVKFPSDWPVLLSEIALQRTICGPFLACGALSWKSGYSWILRVFPHFGCPPVKRNAIQELFQFCQPVSYVFASKFPWRNAADRLCFTTAAYFMISLFFSSLTRIVDSAPLGVYPD